MSTTKELLEEHNELATKHGKLTLKSWKQPAAKLQARIDELKKLDGDDTEETKPVKSLTARKTVKKEDETKKTPKKKEKTEKEDDGLLSIVDIAEELGIHPKVARAKLRRKGSKSNEGRWPRVKPDSKEHKELIALLKPSTKDEE